MAVSSVQAITISKKKPFRWSYGSGYGATFIIECFFATKGVTMALIQFCHLHTLQGLCKVQRKIFDATNAKTAENRLKVGRHTTD